MKRLRKMACDQGLGSPYIHHIINDIVINDSTKKHLSDESFLLAKMLLADIPMIPTSERIYDLRDQINNGLFNDIVGGEANRHTCKQYWKECLFKTREYLRNNGYLCSDEDGGVILDNKEKHTW